MSMEEFKDTVSEFFSQGWDSEAYVVRAFSTYNVDTSENIQGFQRIPVRVITLDYLSKTTNSNSLILSGDKQVYMKPSFSIGRLNVTTDKLEIAGVLYKIVVNKEFNPASEYAPIYYELFVRT